MWLLEHLDPTSLAYNRPQAYALDGPLNVGALRQAITDVVARHDSLRTAVTVTDGLPVARLDDVPVVDLPLTDLSGLSGPDQERRIHDAVALDARTPFDSDARAAAPRPAPAAVGVRTRAAARHPSRRLRRLVGLGVLERPVGPLQRAPCRRGAGAPRSGVAGRRLRVLAAP